MRGNKIKNNPIRVVIISACPVSTALAHQYIKKEDHIIACDAGYKNAECLGVVPDWIVGDFDSAPLPRFPNLKILPREKDDTDTHYAARMSLQYNPNEVVILGAIGGERMDHTIANLQTGLWLAKQGVRTVLADERCEVHYLLPGQPLVLRRQCWHYLSLFAMGGVLEGVFLSGVYYPLKNASLSSDYPLGISNQFTEDTAVLSCTAGSGLVFLTYADD